jgi:hypothetical protein
MESVIRGSGTTEVQRATAARAFLLAMRRDLRPDTKLAGSDYRFFIPTEVAR